MSVAASPRVPAAAFCVAFLSLASILEYYRTASDSVPDRYGVTAEQERFREAAALLPADAVVGYLSDLPLDEPRGSAAFFAVQYALAPRILVELTAAADRVNWVVGNYSRPPDLDDAVSRYNLTLVRDCGRGVILFRRSTTASE